MFSPIVGLAKANNRGVFKDNPRLTQPILGVQRGNMYGQSILWKDPTMEWPRCGLLYCPPFVKQHTRECWLMAYALNKKKNGRLKCQIQRDRWEGLPLFNQGQKKSKSLLQVTKIWWHLFSNKCHLCFARAHWTVSITLRGSPAVLRLNHSGAKHTELAFLGEGCNSSPCAWDRRSLCNGRVSA